MRAHDAAPRRDALVEQTLHQRLLLDPVGQAHAVALPVGARPGRLERQTETLNIAEEVGVALSERTPPRDEIREALDLLASDRRLDIGHSIVVAEHPVVFEDDLR